MPSKPQLKFATFNLYNLQIPGEPMYRGQTHSAPHYRKKVLWTASLIKKIDADIIGFQELWHPDALKDVFEEAGLSDEYTLVSRLFPGSIGTAMAVKKEHRVVSRSWTKAFPSEMILKKRRSPNAQNLPDYKMAVQMDNFSRGVLKVKIEPAQGDENAPAILVYVAHLKSKLAIDLDSAEYNRPTVRAHSSALGGAMAHIRRIAESAALRVILNKAMKGTRTPVVLLGDLNDTEHSVTNSVITADPSYRLFASSRVGAKSDAGLYSSSSLQEYRNLRNVAYTHVFNGRHETLDHILVSEQFYDYSKNRKWSFKEMHVYNDFLEDKDKSTGDHAVVTSTFVFDPM